MIKLSQDCQIDLKKLIATRMLINANSGGGKSWAIRRLLEQSHGQVQQIVIDLEGEFSTLREKYDYLLVGKDGEIPANIRTAELLAKRLLELNVSTIIDLSELKQAERITFVKRFLDSLIHAPKELWHPALIVVDEAHHFCPEKAKSESASSVIDLMTRGRKRGFCGIIATQRISKLSKDAIAEANNYMIGRASLDIDQKRASETLGFVSKEDTRSLRDLKAGEFYFVGSAFSHIGINKSRVGDVKTTHPDRTRGTEIVKPSETPDNIKKMLKDVVDLPKEAEEELRTMSDMKKKIQELKTKLTIAEKQQPKQIVDEGALQRAKEQGFREGMIETQHRYAEMERSYASMQRILSQIGKLVGKNIEVKPLKEYSKPKKFSTPMPVSIPRRVNPKITQPSNGDSQQLRAGAMKMLNWLAGAYPNSLTKQRLATLSGFSVKGGTFNTYISELKRNGWIVGANKLSITDKGINNANAEPIPSGEELLNLWKSKFREGAGKILQYVYENYPNEISKEEIGMAVGFEPSGGTFNTYLSELRRNGLIEVSTNGVKISEEFFE